MVSAPRRGWEGSESPGAVPHGTHRLPKSLPPEAHLLFTGIQTPFVHAGSLEGVQEARASLGHLRVPGHPWEDSSHSQASPSPSFSNLENEKKERQSLLILQKELQRGDLGARRCHVICFLNLGCVCVCVPGLLCIHASMGMPFAGHQGLWQELVCMGQR